MKPKVCAHTVAWLVKALIEQPRTPRELMDVTGLGRDGVNLFCKSMHEQGAVHIVDWRFDGANYNPVYALGPGEDVVNRWNKNERKLFEIFGKDLLSRSNKEIAKLVGLDPSTIRKDLNVLTEKGYLIRNSVKASNEAFTWRRNPKMAFPDFGTTSSYAASLLRPDQRPKSNIPQQTWFSAIT